MNNAMIQESLGMVRSVARKFEGRGLDREDLIQEGLVGLMIAKEKFDPSRGIKFNSFAVWWVRLAMQRSVEKTGAMVRLPASRLAFLRQIHNTEKMLSKDGSKVSAQEIAEYLGVNESDIHKARQVAASSHVSSLSSPIGEEGDRKLEDTLEDSGPSPSGGLDEDCGNKSVLNLLKSLDERARVVVSRRLGLEDEPETLEAIAKDLGLTRERVRQIEAQSLEKLKRLVKL